MKKINPTDIIYELQSKWNITDESILSEINNKYNGSYDKYGMEHYLALKNSLDKYLNQYSTEEKIAYLHCKKLNYKSLDDPTSLDFLISIMTGGFVFSFFDEQIIKINGPFTTAFLALILIMLIVFKCFVITNRKYKFILSIIDDIESTLSKPIHKAD